MDPAGEPEFDWSQAASLLGDDPNQVAPDMAEIAVEMISSSEQHLQELRLKDAATARREIGAQAHQLRGSLLNFGFVAVGKILLKIEKDDYSPADYPAMVDDAEKAFVASKKLLAARYPSLKL